MLLEQHQQADAGLQLADSSNGSTWQQPWGSADRQSGPMAEPCPPPAPCNCSAETVSRPPPVFQQQRCNYGAQPGVWLFPPELEPNVTLWDFKYKALDPACEPQPLVQHYMARQRMVANSTGPTEELLEWTKEKVR